ncbi:MAG: cysteine desulfurase [Proteobacteria bacterium]|nr:cysteine desulfurase [Pseudomonadota bacterium]
MNVATEHRPAPRLDLERIQADFPILSEQIYGKRLVFLDSAASAQKPRQVIDAERMVYEREYANIHRGVYYLSQRATDAFEAARETTRAFLNARDVREIVFLRGATEGVNLVAYSWGLDNLKAGDAIVLSTIEHHSNIVPWQLLRDRLGFEIRVAPVDEEGQIDMAAYRGLLDERVKLVAMTHCANSIGTVTPIREIARLAKEQGAVVLVDGAQAAPHLPIDVQEIGCDFYVFSGHKTYGPSGAGALYGRGELLDAMPPWQGGGEMITRVTFEKSRFHEVPHKFEAGTPNIAGTIALGVALDYITGLGHEAILAHEHDLLDYAMARLGEINSLRVIGTAREKAAIVSFTLGDIHPHDVGTILDREGIAVRVGHHCAQPTMDRFDLPATVRASFGIYNTREDVDALHDGLRKTLEIFA